MSRVSSLTTAGFSLFSDLQTVLDLELLGDRWGPKTKNAAFAEVAQALRMFPSKMTSWSITSISSPRSGDTVDGSNVSNNHLGWCSNLVNNGINMDKLPTSTGERRISEPSTVSIFSWWVDVDKAAAKIIAEVLEYADLDLFSWWLV